MYQQFVVIALLLFAIAAAYAAVSGRTQLLLTMTIAAFAFNGWNVHWLGTVWSPGKVTILFAVIYLLIHPRHWLNRFRETQGRFFLGAFIWACLVSFCISYLWDAPFGGEFQSGVQGSWLRPIVQLYAYISTAALYVLAVAAVGSPESQHRFLGRYVLFGVLTSVIALLQLLLIALGRSWVPILRMTGEHSSQAAFSISGVQIQRLFGFTGEPKDLAVYLMPLFLIVLWDVLSRHHPRRLTIANPWLVALFGTVLVLTFSTAGLVALALGLLVTVLLLPLFRPAAVAKLVLIGGVVGGALAVGIPGVVNDSDNTREVVSVDQVLLERTTERLEAEYDSRKEYRALRFVVLDAPAALPFGLGPGMYNFHVEGLHFGRGVQMLNSGWITALLDLGVVGTGLLALWIGTILLRAHRRFVSGIGSNSAGVPYSLLGTAGLVAASFAHLGANALPLIFIFAGFLEAALRPQALAMSTGANQPQHARAT